LKDLKYTWPGFLFLKKKLNFLKGFGWGLGLVGIYIACEQLGIIKKKAHGGHHDDKHH
jgi:hypothetical protein